jgi:acetyl esterase/lipase
MLSWEQLDAMPLPPAVARIPYGPAAQQFGELRLPGGAGPHPVVVLIHGGCWRNRYDLVYMTRLAAWLATQGWASWTIEYRRLGDVGGGWPGTLKDVGTAADALRTLAKSSPLDLNRVIAAGHSAGGQLALWLASRAALAPDSDLYQADPLPLAGVLGLAAICDLDSFRIGPPDTCHAAVDLLLQGSPEDVPRRYADASPQRRLPLAVRQAFVQGEDDDTVAADSVRRYVQVASAAGDAAKLWALPAAGHFDVVVATPASEPALRAALDWLLD